MHSFFVSTFIVLATAVGLSYFAHWTIILLRFYKKKRICQARDLPHEAKGSDEYIGPTPNREMLLKQIRRGEDKPEQMRSLYRQLGYLQKDIKSLDSSKWWVRIKAIRHLGYINEPDLVRYILPLLYDPVRRVRLQALETLSAMQAKELQFHVFDILEENGPNFLHFIILQLYHLRVDPKVLADMIEDDRVWIRRAAASLLIPRDKRSDMNMVQKLLEDPDADVRKRLVYNLGVTEARWAEKILRRQVQDLSEQVRAEVATSLGKRKTLSDFTPLEVLTDDESFEVRLSAFLALSNFGEDGRIIIDKYRKKYPMLAREATLKSY